MFIVTILGKKHLFLNTKNDDFLRFLPEQFDCEPSDIQAEYVDEADQKLMRRTIKMNPEKQFEFDLEGKKLKEISRPQFAPGQANPNFILNRQAKDDAIDEADPKALRKGAYQKLTEEQKKDYLLSITWVPRIWEKLEYQNLIGTSGADAVFNADSPECKTSVREVASFSTKKVKAIKYKRIRNAITGQEQEVMDSMELEP